MILLFTFCAINSNFRWNDGIKNKMEKQFIKKPERWTLNHWMRMLSGCLLEISNCSIDLRLKIEKIDRNKSVWSAFFIWHAQHRQIKNDCYNFEAAGCHSVSKQQAGKQPYSKMEKFFFPLCFVLRLFDVRFLPFREVVNEQKWKKRRIIENFLCECLGFPFLISRPAFQRGREKKRHDPCFDIESLLYLGCNMFDTMKWNGMHQWWNTIFLYFTNIEHWTIVKNDFDPLLSSLTQFTTAVFSTMKRIPQTNWHNTHKQAGTREGESKRKGLT